MASDDECLPFSQLPRYSQNFTYEGTNFLPIVNSAFFGKSDNELSNHQTKPQRFNIEKRGKFLPLCLCHHEKETENFPN